jgi:hypothetical protein
MGTKWFQGVYTPVHRPPVSTHVHRPPVSAPVTHLSLIGTIMKSLLNISTCLVHFLTWLCIRTWELNIYTKTHDIRQCLLWIIKLSSWYSKPRGRRSLGIIGKIVHCSQTNKQTNKQINEWMNEWMKGWKPDNREKNPRRVFLPNWRLLFDICIFFDQLSKPWIVNF